MKVNDKYLSRNYQLLTISVLMAISNSAQPQQNFALYPHAPGEMSKIRALEESPSGKIWMAYSPVYPGWSPILNEGSFDYFDGTNWTNYNYSNMSFYGYTYAMAVDSNDVAWIATDTGLVKFEGSVFTRYNKANSTLPGNYIQDICIDYQGNKWMICKDTLPGVHNFYIVKYDGAAFTTFSLAQTGISPSSEVNTNLEKRNLIIDSYQNNVYVKVDSLSYSNIYRYDQVNWTNLNAPAQYDMQIDGNGDLWSFGGNYFYKYNGSNWTPYIYDDTVQFGYSSKFGFVIDKKNNSFYTYGSDLHTFYVRAFHNFNFAFFDRYAFDYPPYISGVTWGKWNAQRDFMWLNYPSYNATQIGSFVQFNPEGISYFSGSVYHDQNNNGIRDTGEPGIINRPVLVSSSGINWHDLSGSNGNYFLSFTDSSASYSLTAVPPLYWMISSSPSIFNLSPLTDSTCCYDFGLAPDPGHIDVRCFLNGPPDTRPGWNFILTLNYENLGTVIMNDTITLNLDAQSSYVSASPVPDVINPNQLKWSYSGLQMMEQRFISITLHASATLSIGDTLHFTAIINPVTGDENAADNSDTFDLPVINSFDPNIKVVLPAGAVSPSYIGSGNGWFDYTIHFQNTGTAPAIFITINDTISNLLDLSTLNITGFSFPVSAELIYPRLLRFSFNNIMLPDSNTNEPASHGFVSYRIKAFSSLSVNDTIYNTALIYFDSNPAVITNTTENFIDPILNIPVYPGTSDDFLSVFPNPALDKIYVTWNISSKFKNAQLILYNNNGLKINSCEIDGERNSKIFGIKLSSGVYTYTLVVDGKVIDSRKMVKAK